jgi:hypothetical protein
LGIRKLCHDVGSCVVDAYRQGYEHARRRKGVERDSTGRIQSTWEEIEEEDSAMSTIDRMMEDALAASHRIAQQMRGADPISFRRHHVASDTARAEAAHAYREMVHDQSNAWRTPQPQPQPQQPEPTQIARAATSDGMPRFISDDEVQRAQAIRDQAYNEMVGELTSAWRR